MWVYNHQGGSLMIKSMRGDQKGVVLVIALIMLLVLTLFGVSSISSTFYETKISGNDRFGAAAFYAAKGGVNRGISQLPSVTAYSGNIGSDETYRSGKMTPGTPQPLVYLGAMGRPGYDVNWEFRRYQVNATGQSFGATKEIEVQVSLGPYNAGTQYNN
jgi:Tfp pilus assembly protein PilX